MTKRKVIEDSDDEEGPEGTPEPSENGEAVLVNLEYSPPSKASSSAVFRSTSSIGERNCSP